MGRTNAVLLNGIAPIVQETRSYDSASRLFLVGDGGLNTATYSHLANSPLVSQITFKQSGTTTRMTTTKNYDFLNRLLSISSSPPSSSASPIVYSYLYNDANQRIRVTLADGSFWIYLYDNLGQVTSGKRYWQDGTPVAGQQFEYGFDDSGNRSSTKAGGDQNGANLRSATYSANNLNQYNNRTIPNAVDITGVAIASSSVTVNSQSPYRHIEYFRYELGVNNSSSPVWQSVTVSASGQGSSQTGNIYIPKTPEQFGFDLDGNLTSDGRWSYTWDAENRLVSMQAISTVPSSAKLKLDFAYDYKGRRIQKTVSTWNGSSYGSPVVTKFVYDGWNLIATLNSQLSILDFFMWGSDLSGSLQGAGGIGGLLEINDSVNGVYFPVFDGNGNVAGLAKAADATVCARYEYGPFAELIRGTGPMARANPFRFSSKYQDDETDLLYFGYRFYSPNSGRWPNRDPLEDISFATWGQLKDQFRSPQGNAYRYLRNETLLTTDPFGLYTWGPGYGCCRAPDNNGIPPLTSWPIPSGYKGCCCDSQHVKSSLAEMNRRFNIASQYLRGKGITPDADESQPNTLSCFDSAEAIIKFMSPSPPCWVCFLEERGPWLPGMYSHNAIVCFSVSQNSQNIYFDWFGGATKSQDYSKFTRQYPTIEYSYPEDRPEHPHNDCESKQGGWSPDYGIIQKYIDQNPHNK